ncbi:DUF1700 domain-containing protein [Clostridium sp.]|uniref:DUF1700 domain-containing protein n=1 Tax=Clostridium sp. TaxID=1506 RepID=UPI0032165854
MNKNDFLDILRDYLKGTFNQHEINDILRDYEEFFLNGELQGKSDEEIIKNLGSPKSIAKELIEEMKGQSKASASSGEMKEKISRNAKNLWETAKVQGRKAGNKTKEFLDSKSVLNGRISGAGVKLIMVIISVMLFFPSLVVATSMIAWGVGLIAMSIGNFAGYLGAAILMGINLGLGVFGIFACIAWTGFAILFWTIYCLVCKGIKYLVVKYISWIKTRNMYVRVKNQQTNNNNEVPDMKEEAESQATMEYNYDDSETKENTINSKELNKEQEFIAGNTVPKVLESGEEAESINGELTHVIDVEYEEKNKKNEEDGTHE